MSLENLQYLNEVSPVELDESTDQQLSNGNTGYSWSERYGEKHRFRRVEQFPRGMRGPQKVRIYRRASCYLLQWWDRDARRNLAVRVNGDLLDALARAREIDERLVTHGSSGIAGRRLRHSELVSRYQDDLRRRANAGEISPKTVDRYRAALSHFVAFTEQPQNANMAFANQVGRNFALGFAAFLNQREVPGNGRFGAPRRKMLSGRFVLDAVRSIFEWSIDPDRGHALPRDFRNPFRHAVGCSRPISDMTGAPDITAPMAAELLAVADDFQLSIFSVLLFFGLRAAEPCALLSEDIKNSWLHVDCKPGLEFTTKGYRNKRFPLDGVVGQLLNRQAEQRRGGMLFVRREIADGRTDVTFPGTTQDLLVGEYRRRLAGAGADSQKRAQVRDQLFHDSGALNYDAIETEFKSVARRLNWPKTATLKDLRHLFCTAMSNAGMPEGYRRFLMGHAPGREAIVAYTHLNKLTEFYTRAIETELAEPLNVLRGRLQNEEVLA